MKATKSKNPIEREFGVPIPGEIVARERWTRTALKRLPAEGPLHLEELFGRSAPLVVDVGCGNGRFLLASAIARPDHDHLGVDILPMVLRYATRRANQRGLANVRFAACDGLRIVRQYLVPASVREVHCYHPQPFHEPEQAQRRLIAPEFLALVHRVLEPGGLFFLQTDNEPYWHYMMEVVPAFFDFQVQDRRWPDAPKGRTRREILALRRRMPVFRGWGRRRDLPADTLQSLVRALPPPAFDAGPRRRDLDALERE
ncbi:MAG: methyltransferase domain-containing protein [Gemmataceae bacterium]|nr:methyltransferase domain-containing protein [Gemmataceae bacterium]MCI0740443.1 methyltransferase domain-containing protein [Gemmataceae bacterium]